MNPAQPHILVVDDSEDFREMVAVFLRENGYRVSMAGSGREGLQKTFGLMPDLVLLDLWLPEISGWEVLHQLKSNAKTMYIPLVVLTGYTMAPPRECDGFLMKPFHLAELKEVIAHKLNARVLSSLRRVV